MGLLGSISSAVSKAVSKVSSNGKGSTTTKSSSGSGNSGRSKSIDDYSKDYAAAKAAGNAAAMKSANEGANAIRASNGQAMQYASGDIASVARKSSGGDWIGGSNSGGIVAGQQSGTSSDVLNRGYYQAVNQYEAAQRATERAMRASVEQNVNNLSSQKYNVKQAGSDANTAAHDAYMKANNNYGANAEKLAASGLSNTGLSESSKVSVGNTYQNALNANKQGVNEQLNSIDLAIENARLTGDIQTASSLASYAEKIAGLGYTNAQNVLAASQWDTNRADSQAQNKFNNNLATQQFEQTKARISQELALGKISMEQAQQELITAQRSNTLGAKYDPLNASLDYQKNQQGLKNAQIVASNAAKKVKIDKPKTYNSTQYQNALSLALQGDASPEIKKIVEGYSGLPFASVLKANGYKGETIEEQKVPLNGGVDFEKQLLNIFNSGASETEKARQVNQLGISQEELNHFARKWGFVKFAGSR